MHRGRQLPAFWQCQAKDLATASPRPSIQPAFAGRLNCRRPKGRNQRIRHHFVLHDWPAANTTSLVETLRGGQYQPESIAMAH